MRPKLGKSRAHSLMHLQVQPLPALLIIPMRPTLLPSSPAAFYRRIHTFALLELLRSSPHRYCSFTSLAIGSCATKPCIVLYWVNLSHLGRDHLHRPALIRPIHGARSFPSACRSFRLAATLRRTAREHFHDHRRLASPTEDSPSLQI